ncbi:MAG: glycosyltransferase family 39 protein [Flavobacteriales bacterium]|nr:glycosyltransferase family 39 protein [Flavobacteriales bacterium]
MLKDRRTELLIVLAALVLFVPGLGAVHLFDWDEINFAEISREMIATGDHFRPQVNFQPFWEKPPLFMWMQVVCMRTFGVGEFAARLPNAICGIVTLLVLFRIGSRSSDRAFGMLWVLTYVGSILPHLYFRSGIIDPWFNLFIFLSVHSLILLSWGRKDRPAGPQDAGSMKYAVLMGLFLGLGVLTKGPVAPLILGLTAGIYWVLQRFRLFVSIPKVLLSMFVMFAVAFLWFGVDWLVNGSWFLDTFITYQIRLFSTPDAGHGGFFGYHFVVLLFGCFPASLFAIQELAKPTRGNPGQNDYHRWMAVLFWVVLILFSIVKSKIVHYSSMCYFPLTYLAAVRLHRIWSEREAFGWSRFAVGILGTMMAVVIMAIPFIGMNIDIIKPLIADPFGQANMDAEIRWTGAEAMAGLWLLALLIAAHVLHSKGRFRESVTALFGGTALFVTLTLFFFINNIEGYSQRAAIDFYEERQGEKCYVIPKGFRSYAQLFYTRKQPVTDPRAFEEHWLLHGDIDRPVYVVCKITHVGEVDTIPTLTELHRKNGFVFFRRDP